MSRCSFCDVSDRAPVAPPIALRRWGGRLLCARCLRLAREIERALAHAAARRVEDAARDFREGR